MQSEQKSKLLGFFGLVVVVIIIILLVSKNSNSPYQVLTPEHYPPGTTVSLYKGVPPEFPKEVILENKEITKGDTVSLADGKKQVTISYISEKSVEEAAALYIASFENSAWKMVSNNTNPKVSTVHVTRNTERLIITIVPNQGVGAEVTFQYEK
jgi:hypothetical protein